MVWGRIFIWTRFGDPSVSPNRSRERGWATCRVKSRFPSEICRVAARSGLNPSNRPQIIEVGLWGRQGLHQSLLGKMDRGKAPLIPSGQLPAHRVSAHAPMSGEAGEGAFKHRRGHACGVAKVVKGKARVVRFATQPHTPFSTLSSSRSIRPYDHKNHLRPRRYC